MRRPSLPAASSVTRVITTGLPSSDPDTTNLFKKVRGHDRDRTYTQEVEIKPKWRAKCSIQHNRSTPKPEKVQTYALLLAF